MWLRREACGILISGNRIEQSPRQQKHGVLTTGLPKGIPSDVLDLLFVFQIAPYLGNILILQMRKQAQKN